MEFKELLPVICVAFGWGLSEFANALRSRTTRLRSVRRAITTLCQLNFEMLQIKMSQEFYKNSFPDSIEEWNRGRKKAFENQYDSSIKTEGKIDEAISLISEEFPLVAYRLNKAVKLYRFQKNANLDRFLEKKELYLKMLTSLEVSQISAQGIVEEIMLYLAFKVDIFLWLSLKSEIRKFKKSIENGDLIHFSQIIIK